MIKRAASMKERKFNYGLSAQEWNALSLYGKFEQVVSWALSLTISVIIVVALIQLVSSTFRLLVLGALDPLEDGNFHTLFGTIMTLLIAMEFNHSVIHAASRDRALIKVRMVLLVALMALSRKYIILDLKTTPASSLLALGAATLALGGAWWLLRDREAVAESSADRIAVSEER